MKSTASGYPSSKNREKKSEYPGLYSGARTRGKLKLVSFLEIPVRPRNAFVSLYTRMDNRVTLALFLLSALSIAVLEYARYFTVDYSISGNPLWVILVRRTITMFLYFSIISLFAASYARIEEFGRGDFGVTGGFVALVAPWYVVWNILQVIPWDLTHSYLVTIGFLILEVVWILWVLGSAVSVANDLTLGKGVGIAFAAGIVGGSFTWAISPLFGTSWDGQSVFAGGFFLLVVGYHLYKRRKFMRFMRRR